jgi:transcriptional regulator GlxA family with amidase domain
MARAACFSRRQFHRLMVQVLGETPGTHQRRLRLDRGAWLLLASRATVLDVALETGFENHETFTRAFRARFGVTPSAFRKNRGRHCHDQSALHLPLHSTRRHSARDYNHA